MPLDAGALRERLVDHGPYAALDVVTVTGSTNTDLGEEAGRGAADRTVRVAEEQTAGRGRMRRGWVSPRYHGLHVSVLLRPGIPSQVPHTSLGWVPLLAGIALTQTVRNQTGLRAALKWPNDLLLGGPDGWRKAAGILADAVTTPEGMAVVVGIGVNVHHRPEQLPSGAGGLPATSLEAHGVDVDRQEFLAALLSQLAALDDDWRGHHGDVVGSGLLARYQELCGTLGQQVRVELGGQDQLCGTAHDIDSSGRLIVRGVDGALTPVSAGDVVHLRPAASVESHPVDPR